MANAGRVAIVPKGEFENGALYKRLDLVRYQKNIYIAKKDNTNILPTNDAYWMFAIGGSEFQPDGVTIESDENGNLIVVTGQPNGVAGLDENGKIPEEQIPENIGDVEFESGDALDPESYTSVALIEDNEARNSFMGKVSTMVKNVRYLFKMMGNTDISAIGNGTVTGALRQLNTDISTAITTKNIGQQSVNYANSAGSAVDQTARNSADLRVLKQLNSGNGIFECADGAKTYVYFDTDGNLSIRNGRYITFKQDGLYVGGSKKVSW